METAIAFNPCGTLCPYWQASILLKDTVKTNILTAAMRELLMRAYLQIHVNGDQEKLTVDYAARVGAMQDQDLIDQLTALSRDAFAPNRIAQEALCEWRKDRRAQHIPPGP